MSKDGKNDAKRLFESKELQRQIREAGENHRRDMAAAYERMERPDMASAQEAAYNAALPDMLALPAAEVRWPAQDPRLRLNEALNCAEAVMDQRQQLEAGVGHKLRVDLMLLLERYALATMHAFKAHRANPPPPGSLPKLVHDGAQRRGRLGMGCSLAFQNKPKYREMLQDIDGSTIPEAIAYDIFRFKRTMVNSAPETGAAGLANFEELAHAEQVATTLLQAATNPNLRDALHWPTSDMYARAYTLAHRAYYEAELGLTELELGKTPTGGSLPYCAFCDVGPMMLTEHDRQ